MSVFLLLLKSLPALVPFIAEIIKQKSNGGVTDRRAKNPLVPWLVITVFLLLSCMAYGISFMSEHNAIERKLTLENAKLAQDYAGEKAEIIDLREEVSFLKRQIRLKDEELGNLHGTNRELTGRLTDKTEKLAELDKTMQAFRSDFEKATTEVREAREARAELEKRLATFLENPPKQKRVKQPTVSKTALTALESLATH